MHNQGHSEISAYIACSESGQLIDAISRLFEAEGMRRIDRTAGKLSRAPSAENNAWSVLLIPGQPGWHLLLALPDNLWCEQRDPTLPPRFVELCEHLRVPGLLREQHADFGRVTLECDGEGQHTLSGFIYQEGMDIEDEDTCHWNGCKMSMENHDVELQLLDTQLPADDAVNEEGLGEYSGDIECAAYVQRFVGSRGWRLWRPGHAWHWLMEAVLSGEDMTDHGVTVLAWERPAQHHQPLHPPEHGSLAAEDGANDVDYFLYSDGLEICGGDCIRHNLGPPMTVIGLFSESGTYGCEPWGVVVLSGGRQIPIYATHFRSLQLLARAPSPQPTPSLTTLRDQAVQGDSDAMYTLAYRYRYGAGLPANELLSALWFEKAAQQGHADAQYEWGRICYDGRGAPNDWTVASAWLHQAAQGNDCDAQLFLARMYENGFGVSLDMKVAVRWLTCAADQGNETAIFKLAWLYFKGCRDLEPDVAEAEKWLDRAGQLGTASAHYELGRRYLYGEGPVRDVGKAVYWFSLAADQGLAEAQFELGDSYDNGRGVGKDFERAAHWYLRAATQGISEALCGLGVLSLHGRGMPQDKELARTWLEQAARLGNTSAHNLLSRLDG